MVELTYQDWLDCFAILIAVGFGGLLFYACIKGELDGDEKETL